MTLALDLDETVVCARGHIRKPDFYAADMGVQLRPYAPEFLVEVSKYYDIVVFTAGTRWYGQEVIKGLDPSGRAIKRGFFRDDCTLLPDGDLTKDLTKLGVPLDKVFLLDNNPKCFRLQPDNAFPILDFLGQEGDNELLAIGKLLVQKAKENCQDSRHIALQGRALFQQRISAPHLRARAGYQANMSASPSLTVSSSWKTQQGPPSQVQVQQPSLPSRMPSSQVQMHSLPSREPEYEDMDVEYEDMDFEYEHENDIDRVEEEEDDIETEEEELARVHEYESWERRRCRRRAFCKTIFCVASCLLLVFVWRLKAFGVVRNPQLQPESCTQRGFSPSSNTQLLGMEQGVDPEDPFQEEMDATVSSSSPPLPSKSTSSSEPTEQNELVPNKDLGSFYVPTKTKKGTMVMQRRSRRIQAKASKA
mgnify:CR=1 FL=1